MEDSVKIANVQAGHEKDANNHGLHPMQMSVDSMDKRNNGSIQLVETFYVTSKKNTVYYVKLTEKGLTLRKETNVSAKEQTILLQDIIGCRCLRSKRQRKNTSSCTCAALPGPAELKVVEENSLDLDESDVSVYLYIYAYILEKSGHRERTTITLRFRSFDNYDQNNEEAQKWRSAIKYLIHRDPNVELLTQIKRQTLSPLNVTPPAKTVPVPSSPFQLYVPKETRKVLVLLNPKSGSGKARETFQKYVAPVFIEAEIPYELQVTKHANYAREFARRCDIYSWRSIVVVGGDGIYYEVINGVFERPDWDRATQTVPIGIIPCGSGNGLARTIAHIYSEPYEPKPVLNAALTVVRGHNTPMDLVRVETKSEISFSFLSVGWGFISDIDIESERLRSIGYQRFAIWSVHRLINLRTYCGTLSYLPAKNPNATDNDKNVIGNRRKPKSNSMRHSMSYNVGLAQCMDCHGMGDCEACDTSFGDILALETNTANDAYNNNAASPYRPRLDSWHSANSRKSAYYSTTESIYQSVADQMSEYGSEADDESKRTNQIYGPASTIPALTAPVPADWTIETGEFIMVHAAYQTHIASDCQFAPLSQLNDGIIWMLVIRAGASRQEIFKFLIGLSSGTHIPTTPNQYMEMIPVTAFRIEPSGTQGHFTVDGERIEYGPIQAEIFPGISQVLVPKSQH